MFIKKTKLYMTVGIVLLINSLSCLIAFLVTYNEKKSLSSALWSMCLAFGATGAALLAISELETEQQIKRIKKRMADRDHWFHSFEYPECTEPKVSIDDTYIPPVETEDGEL